MPHPEASTVTKDNFHFLFSFLGFKFLFNNAILFQLFLSGPEGRCDSSLTAISESRLILCGGYDYSKTFSDVWSFDCDQTSWRMTQRLPNGICDKEGEAEKRKEDEERRGLYKHKSVFIEETNKLYLVGGQDHYGDTSF